MHKRHSNTYQNTYTGPGAGTRRCVLAAGFAALLGFAAALHAETIIEERIDTQYDRIQLVQVADGLEHPWSLAFLPDGRLLVTERAGRLNLIENGEVTEVSGLPDDIVARGQGGLMEVLPHPDFEDNNRVYLTYSKGTDRETATTLIRARLEGENLQDVEQLFTEDRKSGPGRHYGSKLAWTPEGHLLMSIGDRGAEPPRAQDTGDHAGTLLRLDEDGNAVQDNPFVGDEDAHDEIYSYGHRNIQGLVVDPETGTIWVTEHGPRGGDELNRIEAGENYGWPVATRGLDYGTQGEFPHAEARSKEDMAEPVFEFLPTLAPAGLALVTKDHFPNWTGDLLAGGLRAERILRVVIDQDANEVLHIEELLLGKIGRIREIREAPDGRIYILNDEPDAGVFRIERAR